MLDTADLSTLHVGMDLPTVWDHFYQPFRASDQWGQLSAKERGEMRLSDMHRHGLCIRKNKDGTQTVIKLGYRRVLRLLNTYAPGKYEIIPRDPVFIAL